MATRNAAEAVESLMVQGRACFGLSLPVVSACGEASKSLVRQTVYTTDVKGENVPIGSPDYRVSRTEGTEETMVAGLCEIMNAMRSTRTDGTSAWSAKKTL